MNQRYYELIRFIQSRIYDSRKRLELLRGFHDAWLECDGRLKDYALTLDGMYGALYASLYISFATFFDGDNYPDSNTGKSLLQNVREQISNDDPRRPGFEALEATWANICERDDVKAIKFWRDKSIAHNTSAGYDKLNHKLAEMNFAKFDALIEIFENFFDEVCSTVEPHVIVIEKPDVSFTRKQSFQIFWLGAQNLAESRSR